MLRIVFLIGLFISCSWSVGYFGEIIFKKEMDLIFCFLLSLLSVILVGLWIQKKQNFLKVKEFSLGFWKKLLLGNLMAYILLTLLFGLVGLLHVYIVSAKQDDIVFGIVLYAIFFPIWYQIPFGLMVSWVVFLKRKK